MIVSRAFATSILFCTVLQLAGCNNSLPMTQYDYPIATNMPPVVDESLDSLLSRLDAILLEKAPDVASSLQEGLSEQEISSLEAKYSVELSNELKSLFGWHDGISRTSGFYLTPLHEFFPLQDALNARAELDKQLQVAPPHAKQMLGPRLSWVPLFQDVAGDGYYFDPDRKPEHGAIFFNFAETGSYKFFPSLKNVIAGLIECYETGCYSPNASGQIKGDFARASEVWMKYGSDSSLSL